MKLLVVTGGRDYKHEKRVHELLKRIDPEVVYVGDCPTGVDKFTRYWCDKSAVPFRVFEAQWDDFGKAAGPIRNKEMIEAAAQDVVKPILLAFPGGRGTEDCVMHAKYYKIPVLRFEES